MLIKIFSTTVLLVVSWLTVTSAYIWDDMSGLKSDITNIQSSIQQNHLAVEASTQIAIKSINDNINNYIAIQKENIELSKGLDSENKSLRSKIKAKDSEVKKVKDRIGLSTAYTDVLQAEIFSLRKNGTAAATTLLGTKKAIYKAGDTYPKHKDKLRKLMGPIDVLAAKWKKGDYSKTSIEIRKTLKNVIKVSGT